MNAKIARNVIFPLFSLVHAIAWQTCKSQDKDGMCMRLFGLITTSFPNENELVGVLLTSQRPFWRRLFFRRSVLLKALQEQLEHELHEQHARLELVRELNLAMAILCGMGIFTSSERTRTQLLLLETVVYGLGAWDAIQRRGTGATAIEASASGTYFILTLLLLALVATVTLYLQVSPEILHSQPQDDLGTETETRNRFDKLPDTVQELMEESVQAIVSPFEETTRLLFPGEEEAGVVIASVTKPNPDAIVGITLKKVVGSWRIVVFNLSPSSLFASTPLQVGQTILAINGVSMTESMTARDAITIIKDAKEQISVVATGSIFVHVKKATSATKCGFSFALHAANNQPIISKVQTDSLLTGTAVKEGMRVVAINHLVCPKSLAQAAEWVRTTESDLALIVLPTVKEVEDGGLLSDSKSAAHSQSA